MMKMGAKNVSWLNAMPKMAKRPKDMMRVTTSPDTEIRISVRLLRATSRMRNRTRNVTGKRIDRSFIVFSSMSLLQAPNK